MAKLSNNVVHQLTRILPPYLDEAISLFREKERLTRTDCGKWNEFVYCILAGTQFPVRKLKPLFAKLLADHGDMLPIQVMVRRDGRLKLADFLHRNGYRYYNQKAATVSNAAIFFLEKYNGRIANFLSSSSNPDNLRRILVQGVHGVGFKIASHWLRNVGFDVCTVDLHLRRLFYHLGATNDNCDGDLDRDVFVSLEAVFHELAKSAAMPVGIIQYSIWRYSVERCAEFKCTTCVLRRQCIRGRSVSPKPEQMVLF